jgi:2Fe-2S ferredoxin
MASADPDRASSPPAAAVRVIMQDPVALTGSGAKEAMVLCRKGVSLLDAALAHGINIEHACGGVCACSTCHIYILEGAAHLSKPGDDELDRVEQAPGLQANSRLACQCIVEGPGPIVVEVPAWNRNAVKETPH